MSLAAAAFWKRKLGEALLDKQQAAFDEEEATANQLAVTAPNHDTKNRDNAIDALDAKKIQAAAFANAVRAALEDDFKIMLALHPEYTDEQINALQNEFTDRYNEALHDHAIHRAKNPTVDYVAKFNAARKHIDALKIQAEETYEDTLLKAQKERDEQINNAWDRASPSEYMKAKITFETAARTAKETLMGTLRPLVEDHVAIKAREAAIKKLHTKVLDNALAEKDFVAAVNQANQAKKEKLAGLESVEITFQNDNYAHFMGTTFNDANNSFLEIDYRQDDISHIKNNNQTGKNDEAVLDALIEKETEELDTMTNKWWAMWFGIKNSKYFALSCGTTMGGALIMIAAVTGSPEFLAITAAAAFPILYVVTRANWWLTNKPIPDLLEQLAHPVKLVSNFFKKLRKSPSSAISAMFVFISTTVVSLIWAAFTYDTTLELGNQMFDEPAKYGLGMMGEIYAYTALIGGALSFLYQLRKFNVKKPILSMPWLSLVAMGIGLLFWTASPDLFKTVSILYTTIFMTVFTAPTIYAVFGLYTERAAKALKGPVDEDGKDNEFHYKNIHASFNKITADVLEKGPAEIARFKRIHYGILGLGALLALCAVFFIRNLLLDNFADDAVRFGMGSWGAPSLEALGYFAAAVAMVGVAIGGIFSFIDYKNPTPIKNGTPAPIGANMIYKSAVIMGLAAFIGAFAIDIAAEHIMGNVFTKWFGADQQQANILNFTITFVLGLAGATAFYVGSAKRAVERLYRPDPGNNHAADVDDPTGRKRQPDFSENIYNSKTNTRKVWHRIKDAMDLFGTEPSTGTFNKTVAGNTVFNALPALFSGMASMIKGFFFFLCAGSASAAGNYGVTGTQPRELPKIDQAQKDIELMRMYKTAPVTFIRERNSKDKQQASDYVNNGIIPPSPFKQKAGPQ